MGISRMGKGEVLDGSKTLPDRLPRLPGDLSGEPVAILGAGPAGLLAAHAVVLAGREPVIFTKPDQLGTPLRSMIHGAQYLHAPIPDLTAPEPDGMVLFRKIGTAAGYALKVYGDRAHPTSWEKFEGEHPAWALQPVYEELWNRYADRIVPLQIDTGALIDLADSMPLVISTIPPQMYCHKTGHDFPFRPIWITSQSLDGLQATYGPNVILYDGTVGTVGERYRSSHLFGHGSTEYAREVEGAVAGRKVKETNCDCFTDPEGAGARKIVRVGRWGQWKPGVLVDHAFQQVFNGMFDNFEGA